MYKRAKWFNKKSPVTINKKQLWDVLCSLYEERRVTGVELYLYGPMGGRIDDDDLPAFVDYLRSARKAIEEGGAPFGIKHLAVMTKLSEGTRLSFEVLTFIVADSTVCSEIQIASFAQLCFGVYGPDDRPEPPVSGPIEDTPESIEEAFDYMSEPVDVSEDLWFRYFNSLCNLENIYLFNFDGSLTYDRENLRQQFQDANNFIGETQGW